MDGTGCYKNLVVLVLFFGAHSFFLPMSRFLLQPVLAPLITREDIKFFDASWIVSEVACHRDILLRLSASEVIGEHKHTMNDGEAYRCERDPRMVASRILVRGHECRT